MAHWAGKDELARIFGISPTHVDRLRKKFNNAHERTGKRNAIEIDVTKWMKIWSENRNKEAQLDADEKEFFPEGGAPKDPRSLCWQEKALELIDKRHAREQKTITIEAVQDIYLRQAAILRQAGETLGKKFGADAQLVLNEALDDCDTALRPLVNDDIDVRKYLDR